MEVRNRKLSGRGKMEVGSRKSEGKGEGGSWRAESGREKVKEVLSCHPNENAAICGVFTRKQKI
jgi:hypothetical protein